VTDYKKSFVPSLIEETHADLFSNITALSQAPTCEIEYVETSKAFKPPKSLFYEITLESIKDSELKKAKDTEKDEGKYEPEAGDLIALTYVKPKCIDDLNRPKRFYLIAYVLRPRDLETDEFSTVSIRASKPILTGEEHMHNYEKGTLFAVYLMNMTTNVRIWKALHPERGNTNIIKTVLQANSAVSILTHFALQCHTSYINSLVLVTFSLKTHITDALYI
jgi:senataxin